MSSEKRLMKAYADLPKFLHGWVDYQELLRATYPHGQFPNAWNQASRGGPPGCAMAFGRLVRGLGGEFGERPSGTRLVRIPVSAA